MTHRVHNFCAGPCTLPLSVLEQAQGEFLDFGGTGMSVIELSHRSQEYEAVHAETLSLFRDLLRVPEGFSVLFLQGGATLQFAMVPMNLLASGDRAAYVRSGTWGVGAEHDAAPHARVYAAWDGAPLGYSRMPTDDELTVYPDTRYLHITSNETIEGIRCSTFPEISTPLVADMSSDYLSRHVPWDRFDLVYGGAQKNLGPAGVAAVVVRDEVLERSSRDLASYLRYDLHAQKASLLNTPPMFSIYLMGKVLSWIREQGGVDAMQERASTRSGRVYAAIDGSDAFFRSPVDVSSRSQMNVVFRLPSEDLERHFVKQAEEEGLVNLRGHRSVGGIRASIYNGMSDDGVDSLVGFMESFAETNA